MNLNFEIARELMVENQLKQDQNILIYLKFLKKTGLKNIYLMFFLKNRGYFFI